jgi:phosphohistidine phosphatase
MKRLTLVRHAKSSWKNPELADFDRPLNKRGKRDAPRMGERLAARKKPPEVIVSSPAKRARKTAELIARELGISDRKLLWKDEIYEAAPEVLLEAVRGLDERWHHVLLIGHNPGLTELANLLADCGIENIPTCGVLCLDFDVEGWKDLGPKSGSVAFYDIPASPQ